MPATFAQKLETRFEFQGAAQLSRAIQGIGQSYNSLERQATKAASAVALAQERESSSAVKLIASQEKHAAAIREVAAAEENLNRVRQTAAGRLTRAGDLVTRASDQKLLADSNLQRALQDQARASSVLVAVQRDHAMVQASIAEARAIMGVHAVKSSREQLRSTRTDLAAVEAEYAAKQALISSFQDKVASGKSVSSAEYLAANAAPEEMSALEARRAEMRSREQAQSAAYRRAQAAAAATGLPHITEADATPSNVGRARQILSRENELAATSTQQLTAAQIANAEANKVAAAATKEATAATRGLGTAEAHEKAVATTNASALGQAESNLTAKTRAQAAAAREVTTAEGAWAKASLGVVAAEESAAVAADNLAAKWAAVRAAMGPAAIIAATFVLQDFIKGSFQAGLELDALQRKLRIVYGSSAGRQAYVALEHFSRGTSYTMEEIEQAAIKARAFRVPVNTESMHRITTLSYVTGKKPEEVAQAIGRARAGQFRALIGLGVSREAIAELDRNIFDAQGKLRRHADVVRAIFDTLHARYPTADAEMQKDPHTAITNLSTAWKEFRAAFSQGAIIALADAMNSLAGVLRVATQFVLAKQISSAETAFRVAMLKTQRDEYEARHQSESLRLQGIPRPTAAAIKADKEKAQEAFERVENLKAQLKAVSGGKSAFPATNDPNSEMLGSDLGRYLREVLGGGVIAQRGLRATELEKMGIHGAMGQKTPRIDVHVHGLPQGLNAVFEDMIRQYHEQMNRHGAMRPTWQGAS